MVAPLLVSGGLFWLSHLPVNSTFWGNIAPGLILLGLGMGATFVSVTIAATSGVPHHESGLASGILNTSQQIGGALGLAVLTGIATSATARYIRICTCTPRRPISNWRRLPSRVSMTAI